MHQDLISGVIHVITRLSGRIRLRPVNTRRV